MPTQTSIPPVLRVEAVNANGRPAGEGARYVRAIHRLDDGREVTGHWVWGPFGFGLPRRWWLNGWSYETTGPVPDGLVPEEILDAVMGTDLGG